MVRFERWGDFAQRKRVSFYRWRSSAGETGATIEGLEATVVERGAIRKVSLVYGRIAWPLGAPTLALKQRRM